MPEGDTIHRTARALRSRLVGKVVLNAGPAPLKRLAGATVTSVEPVGKHLLMRFSNDLVLHSHMRMNGSWHVYAPGEAWRKPERLARAVLLTEDVVAVCFSAPLVELTREPQLGHLGPDILGDSFDAGEVVRRARAGEAASLGELLLDQRVAAGIGNVYRCEALWWLRLDPWAAPGELTDEELAGLYLTVRAAMRANLIGSGRMFPAYGRSAVHGRAGRPCRRCGSRVKIKVQGRDARMTYYCERCQRPARTSI
jgi:endonuclease-8